MSESTNAGRVYVATETYSTVYDGTPLIIHKGKTRVREGHELVTNNPQYYELVSEHVHFDVETADAVPGEKRTATVKTPPGTGSGSGKGN